MPYFSVFGADKLQVWQPLPLVMAVVDIGLGLRIGDI